MKGFSLIELLISLSVLAILAGITLPSLSQFIGKMKVHITVNEVNTAIHLARESAVHKGLHVVICPTFDHQQCSRSVSHKLMVFIDRNLDFKPDDSEALLSIYEFNKPSTLFHWNHKTPLRYKPNGRISTPGSFIFCPKNSARREYIQRISINRAGRPYKARPRKDGFVYSASGRSIAC